MQPFMIVPAQGSDQEEEWVRLGVQAQIEGKLPLAQQHYQQALRINPRHAIATQNLAIVFAQSNLLNEALLTIERASMFDGVHAVISMNWAYMAMEAERIDLALEKAKKAVEQSPTVESQMALAMILTTAGLAAQSLPVYDAILKEKPQHPAAGPNNCFVQTLTNATPKDLLVQRKRWYEANKFTGVKLPHDNNRSLTRPIRVGYVSGDFKAHSASFIFGAIVLHHNKDIVEPFLYSTLPVDPAADLKTKAFQAVGNWRDISSMSDEAADALIRRDKIDILVDLSGHTNGGRLTLFTRKAAPIQCTAWGFAHGTGVPEIDYFMADPVVVPEAERVDFVEKIWDLPCVVTMEPPVEYNLKAVSRAPMKANGYVTFGSYARYEKLSDQCLATWAEILRKVPDSKLQIKDSGFRRPYAIKRVMAAMPDIAPERLLFSIGTSHADHMLAYQQADLLLDPFPHTGGVVGLEQLYMGVPIITLYGTQPAGRTTSSVLTTMGKTDWIARTPEEYIEKAIAMADDPKMLAEQRKLLRDELLACPAVAGYREAVEAAYLAMWKQWVGE